MNLFEERFGAVLDLIYEAALDPTIWPNALISIADLTGSDGGILIGQSYDEEQVYFSFNGRLSEECDRAFQERHIRNPWNEYMRLQPVGKLALSDEILSLSDLQRTSFYDEVLKPQDVAHNSMMALAARETFRAAFNICRSNKRGPLDSEGQALLRHLSPHLCRSLTLGFRVQGYNALREAAFDTLDQLADGAIILNGLGKVMFANGAAKRLESEGVFSLYPVIRTRMPGQTKAFNTLIKQAITGNAGGTIGIQHPNDGRMLTVLVCGLRSAEQGRLSDAGIKGGSLTVFIIDPSTRQSMAIDRIMTSYGLTRAEARVAIGTSLGRSVPEVALELGVSVNTVKTHLRRIFHKTGTKGQVELASLFAALHRFNGS